MNNLRGAKIIYQESKATQPSHLYFLQKDENYCEAIVTSDSGAKRKLNFNVDLSNFYTKNETKSLLENYYLKSETYNQEEINCFLDLKADLSQLDDYYKKTETLSQTEITNLLNNKQNNLGYTPENVASKSDSYTASSSSTYASTKALVDGLATKLEKGTYTGTASDLKSLIDAKISGTGTANYIPKFSATGTIANSIIYENSNGVSIGDTVSDARLRIIAQGTNATDIVLRVRNFAKTADFFYVNGAGEVHVPSGNFTVASTNPQLFFRRGGASNSSRMQFMTGSTYNFSMGLRGGDSNFHIFDEIAGADRVVLGTNGVMTVNAGLKDQYGNLKAQRTITITGDITLSETHNGAVLNVTNTCNITIPTGLDANFQCVIFAKGSIIVTFVNSGVTVYAPSGLLLKTDKMASLVSTATNNFNLTGELATT